MSDGTQSLGTCETMWLEASDKSKVISNSYGTVVRDFESEAKTRFNF